MAESEKSWGHSIRALETCANSCCSSRGCVAKPVFEISYRYVTGRAGRQTSRNRWVCELHGKKFAAEHNLSVPPVSPQLISAVAEAERDQAALRFAGMHGHPVAAIETTPDGKGSRIAGEFNDIAEARRLGRAGAKLYTRYNKKWIRLGNPDPPPPPPAQ